MAKRPSPVEDQKLHEALRLAILAGRVALKTDPLHLHKPDSPLYVSWDHLAPLLVLMGGSLAALLLGGLALGLAVMTLAILAYIFGIKWWIGLRVQRHALDAMLRNPYNWTTVWDYGGVAVVLRGEVEIACIAPGGDWRGFTRRMAEPASAEAQPPQDKEPRSA